jgi:hypothetical protein
VAEKCGVLPKHELLAETGRWHPCGIEAVVVDAVVDPRRHSVGEALVEPPGRVVGDRDDCARRVSYERLHRAANRRKLEVLVRAHDDGRSPEAPRDRAHDPDARSVGVDDLRQEAPGRPREGHAPRAELTELHRRLHRVQA